ncbi:hypothetical protein ABZS61_20775 [Streptomyces sp. NPDC005566]|uniref:hypothetical protein n=1 Tax=Streptomyces sp. NPDC005566 TaxID=3156886 RepID=UPI0033A63877
MTAADTTTGSTAAARLADAVKVHGAGDTQVRASAGVSASPTPSPWPSLNAQMNWAC